jgi:NAD-dependent deacetylase
MTPEGLERAAEIVASARTLVVATGAGMSRESGIPTFRDAQEGLWASFDPQQLATEAGFRAAPSRVWGWYAHRRSAILACTPHAGHRAVARFEQVLPRVVVVTQNIDGLHQEAGSSDVVELHGSIRRFKCLDQHHPFAGEPPLAGDPPGCPDCGSPLRPDVVWFGEVLPAAATQRAWSLAGDCDAFLVVGTSGVVWPAAELPWVAREAGRPVVEINPVTSEVSPAADVFLQGAAGEVLPELLRRVEELRSPG